MTALLAFIVALLIAFGLTPIVIALYRRFGWLDDPKKKKLTVNVVHTQPLPRGGAFAILPALSIPLLLFTTVDKKITALLLAAALITLVGFWDDLKSPPPLIRLISQIFVAVIVVASGIGIAYITNPFGIGIIELNQPQLVFELLGRTRTIWIAADILAILWIVWCMNTINFSTGLDGQMPGYVAIAAIIIGLLSLRFAPDPSQQTVLILALATAGAYAGFLPWNMYPQKILSGFGASTLAGFLLAVLSILSGAKLATALMVLAVPMIDAASVIIARIRSKRSPFSGDRSHLHHALLDAGLHKRTVAVLYWLATLLLGLLALTLDSREKAFAILLIGVLLCMIVQWVHMLSSSFVKSGPDNG